MNLELPNLHQTEEELILSQRRAFAVINKRIGMGDAPPNVTKAISTAIEGKVPQW